MEFDDVISVSQVFENVNLLHNQLTTISGILVVSKMGLSFLKDDIESDMPSDTCQKRIFIVQEGFAQQCRVRIAFSLIGGEYHWYNPIVMAL